MRKSIREIKEIACEYVEDNESNYAICGNCKHFIKFTNEQEKILVPIFSINIKDCGVCANTAGFNNEPIIMHCKTVQYDANEVCGDDCFEWNEYAFQDAVQARYDAIEQDYWE